MPDDPRLRHGQIEKKLILDENGLLVGSEVTSKTEQPIKMFGSRTLIKTESPDIARNPIGCWHANLIHLQRRQCVLFVHDVSRFALFIPCLTKPDFTKLDWHFQDVLMNSLLKTRLPTSTIERAADYFAPLCFDHQLNRSVQGTLNQLAMEVEHKLWFEQVNVADLLPYSTSAWLSDRPCMIKGQKDCIWPIRSIAELLERTLH